MPPRFAYWTIIAGGQPTAFRAATREELLPTLKQLQSKQPDAVMRWYSRGKLWDSPAEATAALREQRAGAGPRRGREWRPGGQHQDPRDRFKVPRDVKRQRFAARLRTDRLDEPQRTDAPTNRPFRPKSDRPFQPKGDRPFQPKGARPFQPKGARPFQPKGSRPFHSKGDQSGPQKEGQRFDRPFRPKGPRPSGGGAGFRGRGNGGGNFRGGGRKGGGGRGQR